MEFRLGELRDKYDLTDDMQRLEYLRAVCTMLAEIASPVEREVWCSRAAVGCGVTADALKQEVERQRKRNLKNSRKQYERSLTRPTRNAQPQEKKLRYDDIRSAVAEEGVIRLLLLDPGMIQECSLEAEEFTSPVLRRLYEDLRRRQKEGRSVTPSALAAGMEEGEAALLTELLNKPESGGQARETLRDYTDVIRQEKIMKSGDLQEIARLMRKKNKLD